MKAGKSAVDKEKLRTLRNSESNAAADLKAHRKICGQCHNEANWPRHACEAGWDLAKRAARTANDLLVYSGEPPAGQLQGQMPLW